MTITDTQTIPLQTGSSAITASLTPECPAAATASAADPLTADNVTLTADAASLTADQMATGGVLAQSTQAIP